MITQEFQSNRARFPIGELAAYRGSWIAFSSDGRRILASGATLGQLEDRLKALGIDAREVVLESVPGPEDDIQLGAGE